jgi:hypothetical protein
MKVRIINIVGAISTQGEILENASAIQKALKDLDASKNKPDRCQLFILLVIVLCNFV